MTRLSLAEIALLLGIIISGWCVVLFGVVQAQDRLDSETIENIGGTK